MQAAHISAEGWVIHTSVCCPYELEVGMQRGGNAVLNVMTLRDKRQEEPLPHCRWRHFSSLACTLGRLTRLLAPESLSQGSEFNRLWMVWALRFFKAPLGAARKPLFRGHREEAPAQACWSGPSPRAVWCVREATCKLFIACLNYWVNIDPRLWCPRSYLLFSWPHLWCSGDTLGLGSASQEMGNTEVKHVPEELGARSSSGDWAWRAGTSMCRGRPGSGQATVAHLSDENFGKCLKLS